MAPWQREKSVKMMNYLTGKRPVSEVREPSQNPLLRTSETPGALAKKLMFPVPLIDLKLLGRTRGKRCRSFKSAALATLTSFQPSHISAGTY
jgi:hypothetical protein